MFRSWIDSSGETPTMSLHKRRNLTLSEKLEVLKAAENSSQRFAAAKFGISVGVVNSVVKRKRELECLAEMNVNPDTKRMKTNGNEELDQDVWEWFVAARSKNLPVSGPILQEKAREIAQEKHTKFKASNGWLEKIIV